MIPLLFKTEMTRFISCFVFWRMFFLKVILRKSACCILHLPVHIGETVLRISNMRQAYVSTGRLLDSGKSGEMEGCS